MKPTSKIYITAFFLIPLAVFVSCTRKAENRPLYTVEKDGQEILHLDFRSVADTITLKLSDIVEDVKFIQLETNEESMLNISGLRPTQMNKESLWVGEKYIIAVDNSRGLFQFTIEGKFVRKLASPGRGPCEFGYQLTQRIIRNLL